MGVKIFNYTSATIRYTTKSKGAAGCGIIRPGQSDGSDFNDAAEVTVWFETKKVAGGGGLTFDVPAGDNKTFTLTSTIEDK